MPLAVMKQPFDHSDWIFELKYDGFRAIAFLDHGRCRLVSRNGKPFPRFDELARAISAAVPRGRAVLDGEIVCLGDNGEPRFYDLMRGRSPQYFYAFDLLSRDDQDLRGLPLMRRKRKLHALLDGAAVSQLRCVDHVERDGILLFNLVCGRDLEGIVAKKKDGLYTPEATTWVKIKNPTYSQNAGRRGFFEGTRK